MMSSSGTLTWISSTGRQHGSNLRLHQLQFFFISKGINERQSLKTGGEHEGGPI